jgi:hypothetical protein
VNRALRAATMGVLLLSPVALSACSAGQITQTATQQRDKTGGQAQVGDLALRQVGLAYPIGGSYSSGDDAELQMAIANDGSEADTLTAVSGTGFDRAVFTDLTSASATSSSAAAGTTAAATSSAAATTSAAPGASTSSSAAATPTASAPATSSSAAPTSAAPTEIPIPAGETVFVGPTGDAHVTLIGLDRDLITGQYVTLKLTFAKAGEVTVLATVANPPRPIDRSRSFDFNQTSGSNG